VIFSSAFPLTTEEAHAMAEHPSFDRACFLHEHLAQASPALLRSLLSASSWES
jgi:hypothetical protein